MEIKEYTTNKSEFYSALIKSIYKKYPLLIPAKISEFMKIQNPNNPFFKYGSVRNFVLLNDNQSISHVSIFMDELLPKGTITFGFFECENNPEQVEVLLRHIKNKLRAEGISQMYGPVNVNPSSTLYSNICVYRLAGLIFVKFFSTTFAGDIFIGGCQWRFEFLFS